MAAENAAFAAQPWVFGLHTEVGQRTAIRASMGHPNRWGARAYLNAIYPILQREFGF